MLFVWFDAPIGYVSFTARLLEQRGGQAGEYERWWSDPESEIHHFIGEDNTVFHALIWPAMLMADGRHQLPTTVVANNFVNLGDSKVSKSRTAEDSPVWIEEFLKRFDADALRYYLTAIAPESSRTSFEPKDFIARNNNELVAALGNFVNRFPKFIKEDFGGRIPPAAWTDADRAQVAAAGRMLEQVGQLIEAHRFRSALEELMAFARSCNEYIGLREPWKRRKTDLGDCAASVSACAHVAQHLAIAMYPFMPGAARRLIEMLGIGDPEIRWAVPARLPDGHAIGEPKILFAKLEPNAMDANDASTKPA